MRRDSESGLPLAGKVIHVVGCVTDEVYSFLGPATSTLARSGRPQAIVMIDESQYRHHVANLNKSAELLLTPKVGSVLRQWKAVFDACRQALGSGPVHAVHLHGMLPGLVGRQAIRALKLDVPIFFSPHASRAIAAFRGAGSLVLRSTWPLVRAARGTAIVNLPQETRVFESWRQAELVESPVADVFFEVKRNEARHPLIVTGGRTQGVRNGEVFAQLAVLLSGEDLRVAFNWLGSVDDDSRTQLSAAGVGLIDVPSDSECASRLASGWIYVAPGGTRGFPLFLVEAMAAGLPCVVLDCEQHREVIRDGETGFLCRDEKDMVKRIASLIDDTGLRWRLGQAAREDAKRRFGESQFGDKLLAAYALPR